MINIQLTVAYTSFKLLLGFLISVDASSFLDLLLDRFRRPERVGHDLCLS